MSTVQRSSATRAPASTAAADASLGAAALQTLANKIGAAAGDDKDFPDLTSGNRGVRGYELTGARAQQLLDLAGEGTKLKAGERVVGSSPKTSRSSSSRSSTTRPWACAPPASSISTTCLSRPRAATRSIRFTAPTCS